MSIGNQQLEHTFEVLVSHYCLLCLEEQLQGIKVSMRNQQLAHTSLVSVSSCLSPFILGRKENKVPLKVWLFRHFLIKGQFLFFIIASYIG